MGLKQAYNEADEFKKEIGRLDYMGCYEYATQEGEKGEKVAVFRSHYMGNDGKVETQNFIADRKAMENLAERERSDNYPNSAGNLKQIQQGYKELNAAIKSNEALPGIMNPNEVSDLDRIINDVDHEKAIPASQPQNLLPSGFSAPAPANM